MSDRRGRRAPVAAGIAIFCLRAAGCALSITGAPRIAWRVAQAMALCWNIVV